MKKLATLLVCLFIFIIQLQHKAWIPWTGLNADWTDTIIVEKYKRYANYISIVVDGNVVLIPWSNVKAIEEVLEGEPGRPGWERHQ